jgi:hypothetical protein
MCEMLWPSISLICVCMYVWEREMFCMFFEPLSSKTCHTFGCVIFVLTTNLLYSLAPA